MNYEYDYPLIWIDLEMTGLNLKKDQIIEIAIIVTDSNLDNRKEGPSLIIKCPDNILNGMDDWCTLHHDKSGLTENVKKSQITLIEAEIQVLNFIKNDCNIKTGEGILAGNSIHIDKTFLMKDMPNLHDFLHYRIMDVSTIKILCQKWYPAIYLNAPLKKGSHRALEDIKESIEELQYYRKMIMIPPKLKKD